MESITIGVAISAFGFCRTSNLSFGLEGTFIARGFVGVFVSKPAIFRPFSGITMITSDADFIDDPSGLIIDNESVRFPGSKGFFG